MSDEQLDRWLGEARERIAADIASERARVVPDFAAMVARAHERAPQEVPSEWLSEAELLAPVVDLRTRESEALLGEHELDALLGEARELAEHDVAARRLEPIPSFEPRRLHPRSGSRRRSTLVTIGLAAAALLGLALALPSLLDRFVDAARSEATNKHQAEFQDRGEGPESAELVPPRMERSDSSAAHGEAIAVPQPSPSSAELDTPKPTPRTRSGEAKVLSPQGPSLDERVAALDDEAQRRWAAGELEAAAEAFRAIIKLAGKGRHADLAYGDLFTLTRQRKDEAAELALWREYLGRFPQGRFADDARAGVCRRGPEHEREPCWQAYLVDFPRGVHRRAAERALGATEPPSP
jgi:hypothetical protein